MLTTEFKALHNLSNEQFRRMRIKAEQANPGIEIVTRQGSSDWLINDVSLLIPHLPKPRQETTPSAAIVVRPQTALDTLSDLDDDVIEAELMPSEFHSKDQSVGLARLDNSRINALNAVGSSRQNLFEAVKRLGEADGEQLAAVYNRQVAFKFAQKTGASLGDMGKSLGLDSDSE